MEFSIIVATYDRHEFLQRLLSSIDACFGKAGIEHEVIVANNAPSAAMAGAAENIVKEFRERGDGRFSQVREPSPGKCRAQNLAITKSQGSILAFFVRLPQLKLQFHRLVAMIPVNPKKSYGLVPTSDRLL